MTISWRSTVAAFPLVRKGVSKRLIFALHNQERGGIAPHPFFPLSLRASNALSSTLVVPKDRRLAPLPFPPGHWRWGGEMLETLGSCYSEGLTSI